jgi:lipoprotein-anchoring transpeptidase ErfK/SrfK
LAAFSPGMMGKPKELLQGGGKPSISPKAPQVVSYGGGYSKGSVVVDQSQKKLYYVLGDGKAYAYPVAVGKKGFKWTGSQKVSSVKSWPDWVPPEEMRQRKPNLPLRMTGGINNPLGAKAIYLGNSLYRIHGTNDSSSIGTEASSGCIRMHNGHVVHLAQLVKPGTAVHVVH